MKHIILIAILAAALLGNSAATQAEESTKANAPTSAQTETKRKQAPFRGRLSAVDANAQTVSLRGKDKDRVFHVTAESKIKRDAKVVPLSDLRAGEWVGGLARQNRDGNWEVVTLNISKKDSSVTAAPTVAEQNADQEP